ncbi:Ulp1 protease family [Abeliophyllum distichum]|uniref:Ulp1 protease family n=1 Tax=Abeliophyllum distichum TaxID=126358 RepID=A0ABD1SZU1_9LAMI
MDLKKNLTDCPNFSLGIEFEMTGKSIEGPAETNVEKSIDEDIINFNEEDWKIVDDVAAHSLAKKVHQNTVCASSSKTCKIDVNDDDVELKDGDWQKIDEIAAAVLAKHKLEEAIMDDEVTPDAPLKRQKKPAALLQSPWVNQYDSAVGTSTVGTTKRVLKGTSAFKVGLFAPCGLDVEAFESWYKQGLVTKKNSDCGIYVIKYAEYFINEMLKEMPKIFNIAQVRKHLATQLYVYAKRKQVENYDTDNDCVPKDV